MKGGRFIIGSICDEKGQPMFLLHNSSKRGDSSRAHRVKQAPRRVQGLGTRGKVQSKISPPPLPTPTSTRNRRVWKIGRNVEKELKN